MTRTPLDVLLTGASGFLGHYILAELMRSPLTRCRVLLRTPMATSSARLELLLGELGLDLKTLMVDRRVTLMAGILPEQLNRSAFDGVDVVLHAAGSTAFHSNGSGEPWRTNVDGTRAMLAASAKSRVRRFVFVSTAFVCGEQVGHLPEAFWPKLPAVRNDYERSKWEAEQLVWDWGRRFGVATICRPSILFGDSHTGRATAMKGLYLVARATEILARAMDDKGEADRHHIPLRILGRGDATCNVVPIDWSARQIANIALEPATGSSVHHITNPDPPTHEEVKGWLEEYFDIAGGVFVEGKWPLDDANHYEDLFYSLGNICLDYFRHGLTFASRCAARMAQGRRLVDKASFFRSMKFAQEHNWCRSANQQTQLRTSASVFDAKWYFEAFLPETVPRSTVAKIHGLTAVVQYTITGTAGGSWLARFDRGRLLEIQALPTEVKPEFEYRLSHADLLAVATGCKPLQDVFFHGSAEMFGDVERALKMVPIMGAFLKEFPVVRQKPPALAC